MLIDKQGNTTIITQEKATTVELVRKMEQLYNRMKNDNIIVSLTSLNHIKLEDVLEFLKLSNEHRSTKHSFVLVTDKIDYDEAPDELIIVPSMQEALDIIEMEEMERDLGL